MTSKSIGERIPLFAQAFAIVLVILYVIGFVVLSLHNASFGVFQFNLVRPKILAGGVLFCVFVALPVFEAARIYGLFGLPSMYPTPTRADGSFDKRSYYLPFLRPLSFAISAMAMGSALRILAQEYQFDSRLVPWYIGLIVPIAAVAYLVRYRGTKNPIMVTLGCLSALVWIMFCITRMGDPLLAVTLLWFFGWGLMAHFVEPFVMGSKRIREANWAFAISGVWGVLILFALYIYPHIRWSLGGGSPIPISLRFDNKSPLDDSTQADFWLVDETDAGFYVLIKPDGKKAAFLPRTVVRAIYFGTPTGPLVAPRSTNQGKIDTGGTSTANHQN